VCSYGRSSDFRSSGSIPEHLPVYPEGFTPDEALREYIQYRKRVEAVEAFGTIDFDPDFDYKMMRNAR